MVQVSQGDVRRYVGVASTVIGLVCYALSSSFNRLYGEWKSFKICAYVVSSSLICLATLFPKAWQHLSIFHYRAHLAFLVLISTTVYSFYLDRKSKTKPDAYALISSAAFATMSLCMSKSIDCGFLDLMFFFSGVLITQLMEIKPLLGLVGIGVGYFLIIFRSYLDDPVPVAEYLGSRDNYYAAIDIASPQSISNRVSSLDVRPLPPETSIQNFDANFTAPEISQLERPPSLEQLRRLRLPSLAELQLVLRLPGLAEVRPVVMLRQLPSSRPPPLLLRRPRLEQQQLVNQQQQQPLQQWLLQELQLGLQWPPQPPQQPLRELQQPQQQRLRQQQQRLRQRRQQQQLRLPQPQPKRLRQRLRQPH